MPGKHKDKTISFRPSSWERAMIEERAAMSGLPKKDFIAKSCIYSNICVVGTRNNVQRIVDALEEVRNVMIEISSRMTTGDFPFSEDDFDIMAMRYLALCSAIVEITDGAAYLFNAEKPNDSSGYTKAEMMEQLLESVRVGSEEGDIPSPRGEFGANNPETPKTG